jgi:hypothetical protein
VYISASPCMWEYTRPPKPSTKDTKTAWNDRWRVSYPFRAARRWPGGPSPWPGPEPSNRPGGRKSILRCANHACENTEKSQAEVLSWSRCWEGSEGRTLVLARVSAPRSSRSSTVSVLPFALARIRAEFPYYRWVWCVRGGDSERYRERQKKGWRA